MKFSELGDPRYIALETFRKTGQGVATPVWAVAENGKLYVWTDANSGKVKRIRNNGRVRLCASNWSGKPQGEWVDGVARLLEGAAAEEKQRQRLLNKYGWEYRLFRLFGAVARRSMKPTVIEISAS